MLFLSIALRHKNGYKLQCVIQSPIGPTNKQRRRQSRSEPGSR